MLAPSTKQLMMNSWPFRIGFCSSLLCFLVGAAFCGVYPFSQCYKEWPCYWWFNGYYSYECNYYGTIRCCHSSTTQCLTSYCSEHPFSQEPCEWFLVAGGSLVLVAIVLAICTVAVFCHLRKKVKRGDYFNVDGGQQYGTYPQSPVVIYSDQNQNPPSDQYRQQQNRQGQPEQVYGTVPINLSQNPE